MEAGLCRNSDVLNSQVLGGLGHLGGRLYLNLNLTRMSRDGNGDRGTNGQLARLLHVTFRRYLRGNADGFPVTDTRGCVSCHGHDRDNRDGIFVAG